jgi:carbonic anhydrase
MTEQNIDSWISNARAFSTGSDAFARSSGIETGSPLAALIAASDLTLDPMTVTGALPGEIYDIRTVAGLVPPSAGDSIDRTVGAALEFAVSVYSIKHVVLLSHPGCGLVRSLLDQDGPGAMAVSLGQFLPSWTAMAASAVSRVLNANIAEERRPRLCCEELLRVSFENLMTYQWILDGVFDGRLQLHGWYCDPATATFASFDPATDSFIDGD